MRETFRLPNCDGKQVFAVPVDNTVAYVLATNYTEAGDKVKEYYRSVYGDPYVTIDYNKISITINVII